MSIVTDILLRPNIFYTPRWQPLSPLPKPAPSTAHPGVLQESPAAVRVSVWYSPGADGVRLCSSSAPHPPPPRDIVVLGPAGGEGALLPCCSPMGGETRWAACTRYQGGGTGGGLERSPVTGSRARLLRDPWCRCCRREPGHGAVGIAALPAHPRAAPLPLRRFSSGG